MNLFPDFFKATQRAHFDAMAVNLGHLFDTKRGSSSLKEYLRVAQGEFTPDELRCYGARVSALSKLAKDFLYIRNKAVAHQDAMLSEQKVFENADVAPDFNRDLIDDSAKLVDELRRRRNWASGIFVSQRYSEATLGMLEGLEQFRLTRRRA